jgi:hypothetical protein
LAAPGRGARRGLGSRDVIMLISKEELIGLGSCLICGSAMGGARKDSFGARDP